MNYFKKLIKKNSNKPYLIAEACDNHMGSLDMAKALVNAAVSGGASAVKFQHHIANEEMLENSPMSDNFSESLFDFLERNSLKLSDHFELAKYCKKKKITYLCTPFSFKAAQEVSELVPFFKIGSGEFQDHWFIDKLESLKKPILFSSGMCSMQEIEQNISYLNKKRFDFAIMNCLSEYPPKYSDMNLGVIKTLIKKYPNLLIGHSDHSPEIYTSIMAAALGAKIIEKHITLSRFIDGPDKSVSIDSENLLRLSIALNYIKSTMGANKKVNEKEKSIRKWAYRSIVANKDLPKNHIIKKSDICTKRPGIGIASRDYKKVIGKKVRNKIASNKIIYWKDIND